MLQHSLRKQRKVALRIETTCGEKMSENGYTHSGTTALAPFIGTSDQVSKESFWNYKSTSDP